MKILYLFSLLLFLSKSLLSAQDSWELIFENDADGKVIRGALPTLISAIQNGEPIRISWKMWHQGSDSLYVEHSAPAKFTTILHSPNGIVVTAQIDPIVGQVPYIEEASVLLKENLEWSMIAATNGKNDQMIQNIHNGKIQEHSVRRWGTRWFTKAKYPKEESEDELTWTFTYLKAKKDQRSRLKEYIEKNWFRMDSLAVLQGLFKKYELYENQAHTARDWDFIVAVAYFDETTYAGVQEEFEKIRKNHAIVLIDEFSFPDLGEVIKTEVIQKESPYLKSH